MTISVLILLVCCVVIICCAVVTHSISIPNKFMGWYGANAGDLSGQINSFWSRSARELVQARARYPGYTQQLLALEDDYLTHNASGIVLVPDWRSRLQQNAPLYSELLSNGTIVGFFLGDELMWNGFPYEQLTEWSDAIRAQHGSLAVIWENEAYPVYSCSPSRPPPTPAECKPFAPCCTLHGGAVQPTNGIPPALNVTSVDIYSWNPSGNAHLIPKIQNYYATFLKPRLHSHQRLFVVPGADASNHNSKCDFDCYDKECASNAHEFFKWMSSDPMIAGAMPWTWRSCGKGCIGPKDEIGASKMNLTKAAWREVGKAIMNMRY